jgi:ferric-dicitrate binding protein FerR (iron transport regulator)
MNHDTPASESIRRYLDGEATAEETAALESLLLEDPAMRRDFLRYARMDAALAGRNGAPLIAAIQAPARTGPTAPRRRRRVWVIAAAAAVVVLLAGTSFFLTEKRAAPAAQLADNRGDVRVWRNQVTQPAGAGFVLAAGDWILTGKDSAVEVAFPGETTLLKIGAEAEFGVVTTFPDKQLKLTTGTMHASVARQSASHPMMIRTPTAKAEVLGTKFEMNASKERTGMTVTEGRVLIARVDDENGVVVEARQSAMVTGTEPVQVQAIPVTQTLAAGLIAQWKFEEGAGVTAADSSGNGHALTFNKDGAWGTGRFGRALDLHATPAVALSTPIELPGAFTISLWLRIEPGGPARVQPLLTSDGEARGMNSLWLILPPTSPGSGIVLGVSGPQMNSQARAKPGVILAGRWQHVAVCVDGGEGRATFFVDGLDVSLATGLRGGFKLKAPLLIGRRYEAGQTPFDGQIDDVRLYGRLLSGPEISVLAGEPSTSP